MKFLLCARLGVFHVINSSMFPFNIMRNVFCCCFPKHTKTRTTSSLLKIAQLQVACAAVALLWFTIAPNVAVSGCIICHS